METTTMTHATSTTYGCSATPAVVAVPTGAAAALREASVVKPRRVAIVSGTNAFGFASGPRSAPV